MRKWAFIFAIIGIFVLIILMLRMSSIEISSIEELSKLKINQKVFLIGQVVSERAFGDFRIFEINGIKVICECDRDYNEKIVEILGVVSEYEGTRQVSVLEISVIGN